MNHSMKFTLPMNKVLKSNKKFFYFRKIKSKKLKFNPVNQCQLQNSDAEMIALKINLITVILQI